ncbi:MAG: cytochrome c-type biogenesis protein CcmH [Betaproteobacteria bacterium]|nr:cytochrome c-type biogenesis protein CcmH [Betaproteobacteria bacterium]
MMRVLLGLLMLGAAFQVRSDDAQTEHRLKVLSAELRCLVCQNQSLADSNADLAIDLRNEVRAQIVAGKTDEQIKDYLVRRYGDFVLYRPMLKNTTYLLWAGPFLLLLAGAGAMFAYIKRRRAAQEEPALTEEQRVRARELLDTGTASKQSGP